MSKKLKKVIPDFMMPENNPVYNTDIESSPIINEEDKFDYIEDENELDNVIDNENIDFEDQ